MNAMKEGREEEERKRDIENFGKFICPSIHWWQGALNWFLKRLFFSFFFFPTSTKLSHLGFFSPRLIETSQCVVTFLTHLHQWPTVHTSSIVWVPKSKLVSWLWMSSWVMSVLCIIYDAQSLFVGKFDGGGIQAMIDSVEVWLKLGVWGFWGEEIGILGFIQAEIWFYTFFIWYYEVTCKSRNFSVST